MDSRGRVYAETASTRRKRSYCNKTTTFQSRAKQLPRSSARNARVCMAICPLPDVVRSYSRPECVLKRTLTRAPLVGSTRFVRDICGPGLNAAARLFEPPRKSLLLENHVNRFDDSNLRICFAIYNHFMLKLFRSSYIEEVFLCETVVPTTVPSGKPIRIPLPRSGKRGTSQRLYVNVPFRVGICREVGLRSNVRTRCHQKCRCKHQHFQHLSLL